MKKELSSKSKELANSNDPVAVRTIDLVKRYGHFTAVDGVNLAIEKGEVYGLLGPNGAGKTTMIRMLTNILKPTSGEAVVLGKRVPNEAIPPLIGYMPQETALYPNLSVRDNLSFYASLYGLKKAKIMEMEETLLKFVNLEKWRKSLVSNLSGGMKHRVSLACALIHEPLVLFLDEPTVGVDPELRNSFWEYFAELKAKGITVLITTHYMDEASHCDRVGLMREGRLVAEGAPGELLRRTKTHTLEEAFMKFARGAA